MNTNMVFRKKHSTNHALDQNIFACSIFIDLQKAFDTVNHDILLHKPDHYEIRGLPNKCLQSFLSGRSQYKSIKDKSSNKLPITHGVSQGSVLGPLLFILYIKDFNKLLNIAIYTTLQMIQIYSTVIIFKKMKINMQTRSEAPLSVV